LKYQPKKEKRKKKKRLLYQEKDKHIIALMDLLKQQLRKQNKLLK